MSYSRFIREVEEKLDPFNLNPYDGGEPDLDGMFDRQKRAAVGACLVAESAVGFLALYLSDEPLDDDELIADAKRAAHEQIAHLEKYMRLPQNKKLPLVHRQLGGRIDRFGKQSAELLLKAVEVYELPGKLQDLRERAAEHERRREAKIEARRRREAEAASAVAAAPVTPLPKRPKRAPQPRCEKCGKRPQQVGKLCEPCDRWVVRR